MSGTCALACFRLWLRHWSGHAILAIRAIKSIMKDIYHRVKRQIFSNTKMAFFLKLSYSKVRAFFTYLGRGSHFS